jgi:two-component system NtrC family sensor kinase
MKISLRTKLALSFLTVIIISGFFTTFAGLYLIENTIVKQAQDKVRVDLNSAREIYEQKIKDVKEIIRLTATRVLLFETLRGGNIPAVRRQLEKVRKEEALDILTVTDTDGRVILRLRNPKIVGDDQSNDKLLKKVFLEKKEYASTMIIAKEELLKEGEDLAQRAHIKYIPTPKARFRPETEETAGMMIKAGAPIFARDGEFIGIIYGGKLLNQDYTIVDKIKDTVFQGIKYKGKDIGTATIFQDDLRIATNVLKEDGTRAIGTRIAQEVYEQVIIKGKPWIERAFVVNDWYITAYEPIKDISGKIIGILYVGMLEKRFTDLKKEVTFIFTGVTLVGIIFVLAISYFLAGQILNPIENLIRASRELGQGNLEYRIKNIPKDEIGKLAETFNFMADSLKTRDEKLKETTKEQLMRSEKLASIGRLAAGVAHEINNPLTGILTFSHLLLKKKSSDDPEREKLETIINETTRCRAIVKGLLDFARQTKPEKKFADLNEIIEYSLSLVERHASFHDIKMIRELSPSLPRARVDVNQIQQVFMNIIINAQEAMPEGGTLTIKSSITENGFIEIRFIDTGCGVPEENMDKLFDPFFTTKHEGKGTGLGLAVSYGIIEGHQGNIEIQSKLNKGTTVIIRLPF